MGDLFKLLSPKEFGRTVVLATWMNGNGRFRPGQRAMGERMGLSRSTANRHVAKLVALDVLEKVDPGGSLTCRYRFKYPEHVRELTNAREKQFPDCKAKFWRTQPSAAAAAFTSTTTPQPPESGTKGNPSSPPSETYPLPLPHQAASPARARTSQRPTSTREGPAAEPPKVDCSGKGTNGSAALRSLLPRKQADRPAGETLSRLKRQWWQEDNVAWATANCPYAVVLNLFRGDEATHAQVYRQRLNAGWKADPKVRAARRLKRRGSGVDSAERERRKQLLMMRVANWIGRRMSSITPGQFWGLMMRGGRDAQEVFDLLVAKMRAEEPDLGPRRRGVSW